MQCKTHCRVVNFQLDMELCRIPESDTGANDNGFILLCRFQPAPNDEAPTI
jgi:hypothetical protein